MGLLGSLVEGLKGLMGGNKAQAPATPTPAPAPGTTPATPAAPGTAEKKTAKTGAAAVADSLSDSLKDLEKESLENAYGDGAMKGETAREIAERKKDIESRLAANDALKDKFKIVDKKGPGDPSNTLTREEYEAVIKQYSDIGQGKGDLTIDTAGMSAAEAKTFKDGAMGDVAKMLQTQEGREMLAKLGNNVATDASGNVQKDASGNPIHRKTTIGQAYEHQTDASGNVVLDASGRRQRSVDASGNPIKMTDNAYADYSNYNTAGATAMRDASGNRTAGQDSIVGYNPGMSLPGSAAPSDVVLFHELRHAADMTRGNMDNTMVGASDGVSQDVGVIRRFEHQAVGLGNHAGLSATTPLSATATVPWTENQYRQSRSALATAGAPGSIPSEAGMANRPFYNGPMP